MIKFTFDFFRFIKSGCLFDFIFKKLIIFLAKKLFLTFSIFFSEKYFIENIFFRFSSPMFKLVNYISQFANIFATNYIVTLLIVNGFLFILFIW